MPSPKSPLPDRFFLFLGRILYPNHQSSLSQIRKARRAFAVWVVFIVLAVATVAITKKLFPLGI
jgi:hypothetical protein